MFLWGSTMAQTLDEVAAEYRRQLLTLEQKSTEAFDKAVLSLSGGALGLSIAFLNNGFAPNRAGLTGFLLGAWIFWASSLILTLISFWLSARAMQLAVKQLDEGRLPQEHPGGLWDKATKLLTPLGGVGFIGGVGLMIFFVHSNL